MPKSIDYVVSDNAETPRVLIVDEIGATIANMMDASSISQENAVEVVKRFNAYPKILKNLQRVMDVLDGEEESVKREHANVMRSVQAFLDLHKIEGALEVEPTVTYRCADDDCDCELEQDQDDKTVPLCSFCEQEMLLVPENTVRAI